MVIRGSGALQLDSSFHWPYNGLQERQQVFRFSLAIEVHLTLILAHIGAAAAASDYVGAAIWLKALLEKKQELERPLTGPLVAIAAATATKHGCEMVEKAAWRDRTKTRIVVDVREEREGFPN